MTLINPINVNTQGIGSSYGYGTSSKKETEKSTETETASTSEQTPVSADAVLNYMAQSAVSVTPTTTVDPSKYVDSESEARIAGFMSQFEDIVATNLSAISSEFPNMSSSAQQTLALAQVDSQQA